MIARRIRLPLDRFSLRSTGPRVPLPLDHEPDHDRASARLARRSLLRLVHKLTHPRPKTPTTNKPRQIDA